jgi:putative ABC transport system ATP-binding protein
VPPENAFFQLRNVRKVYRAGRVETTALDNITVDIREGEFVAVMGPSGCGKSTLLNIVALLDTPSSGRYTVGGIEVSGAPESQLAQLRKGNIGFIFQGFHLVDHLSVQENVELPLLYLRISRKRRQRRVLLRAVGCALCRWLCHARAASLGGKGCSCCVFGVDDNSERVAFR